MSAERRIRELGITLPPVSSPVATYVNAVQTGNLLYGGLLGTDAKVDPKSVVTDATILGQ